MNSIKEAVAQINNQVIIWDEDLERYTYGTLEAVYAETNQALVDSGGVDLVLPLQHVHVGDIEELTLDRYADDVSVLALFNDVDDQYAALMAQAEEDLGYSLEEAVDEFSIDDYDDSHGL